LHPVVARLREDDGRLVMSASIGIGEFSYAVTLSEESLQTADPDKAERLVLEVTLYRAQGRRCRRADRKTRTVEDHLPAVLRELETRPSGRT
jgi:hypothetical protein